MGREIAQLSNPGRVVKLVDDAVERGLGNEREKRVNADEVDAMEFGVVDERREDERTLLFGGKGVANSEARGRGRHGWKKVEVEEK